MIMKVKELLNDLLNAKEIEDATQIIIHSNSNTHFGFVDETPTRFLNRNVEKYEVEKHDKYSKITIDLCRKK
jgi:hypothetical protein